jgi:hypothetical protein
MKVTEIKVGVKKTKNYQSYESSITALTSDSDPSIEACFEQLRTLALAEADNGLDAIESISKEKKAKAEKFLEEKGFLQYPSPSKCDRTEHECFKMSLARRRKDDE